MNTVILKIASRYVRGLLIIFAVIALLRGHNFPGGGFIGGLLAGLSVAFKGYTFGIAYLKKHMSIMPEWFIISGLVMILFSAIPAFLNKTGFMTGEWYKITLPLAGELKLGTPLIFDFGIFLAIIGITIIFLFSLTEKE
ncbi:MAG: hypothetical protein JXB00_08905 [Bacteroidales bacterium]|nr:hypothetical protein [Bacteroidales bacterium]